MKKLIIGSFSLLLLGACANGGSKYDFSETEKSQKEVATWQPQDKRVASDSQQCLIENIDCEKVLNVLSPSKEQNNDCVLRNIGCKELESAYTKEAVDAKLAEWNIKITQVTRLRDGGTGITTLNDKYTIVYPRPLRYSDAGNIEITFEDGSKFQYGVYDHKRIAADKVFPY